MKELFGKHANEPVWHPRNRIRNGWLSPAMQQWLLDDSSLTRRLQQNCPGRFRVEVLNQGWERPLLSEARALKIRPERRVLVRQVHLLCDDTPWVFARTVIPVTSLRGRQRRLRHLGNRPLGAFLFADPHMRRAPLEIVSIDAGQRLYHRAIAHSRHQDNTIWGRRSVFYLEERPLLVSEIFLPDLPTGEGVRPC